MQTKKKTKRVYRKGFKMKTCTEPDCGRKRRDYLVMGETFWCIWHDRQGGPEDPKLIINHSQKKMTKKELMEKLKLIKPKDKNKRNQIVCVLVGHSRISTMCMGYRYCARCSDQVGDSLGSIDYGIKEAVIVGHDCKICRDNYKKCMWQDKLYCPDPFKKI